MTTEELNNEFRKKRAYLSDEYRRLIKDRLKEIHLDGLVRRVRDGKIGILHENSGISGIGFDFYPITKSGKESEKPNGFVFHVEDEFEPVNE